MRNISDANSLYDAFYKSMRGSAWKQSVQRFEVNLPYEIAKLQKELKERTFQFSNESTFILHERGKVRVVHGETIRDRLVSHALCDEVLTPCIKKYLIYDNGAGLKGKGISFARERLVKHLKRYYDTHHTNEGYILLMDFSKFYDNIRHKDLMDMFRKYISDEEALWLLEMVMEKSRVDVSYMTDEEYERCMNDTFSSLEYQHIDQSLLTEEKFMDKHMNIGEQVAQTAGLLYPLPFDNYIKIVRGIKLYGRYMDDSYAIHESKEYLKSVLYGAIEVASKIGITINRSKTRVCKLSDYWRFLQTQYSLSDTGRIIRKINPKRLTAMRRRMKSICSTMTQIQYRDWFFSWYNNYHKLMSNFQKKNLIYLYETTREECLPCTQSS